MTTMRSSLRLLSVSASTTARKSSSHLTKALREIHELHDRYTSAGSSWQSSFSGSSLRRSSRIQRSSQLKHGTRLYPLPAELKFKIFGYLANDKLALSSTHQVSRHLMQFAEPLLYRDVTWKGQRQIYDGIMSLRYHPERRNYIKSLTLLVDYDVGFVIPPPSPNASLSMCFPWGAQHSLAPPRVCSGYCIGQLRCRS